MKPYVLDASAILAWLWREDGFERVSNLLADEVCLVSSVNLAEVITKALDKGLPPEHVDDLVASLELEIRPFAATDAAETARLRPATRALGLSLGDRACLALAKKLDAIAVTADRPWLKLDPALEIHVECIRSDTN